MGLYDYPDWRDAEEEQADIDQADFDCWYLGWLSWQWGCGYEDTGDEQAPRPT